MIDGLDLRQARLAMARAMGSKAELSAAAHVPARGGSAVTAFRIEGFGASVTARCRLLDELLGEYGAVRAANEEEADGFWSGLRTLASLGEGPLWRVNVAPSAGPAVIEALEPLGARWLFDWAGGLVWLTFEGDPLLVRRAAVASGGHATLVRAPEELRARVPALHPPAPGVMALEARLRRAFDPNGLFETGRFLDTGDAD
jgi:glycolate oxidase FAD binding subunit